MNSKETWMKMLVAGLCLTGATVQATLYSYNFNSGFTGGSTVADGSTAGWTDNRNISDITGGNQILDLSVRLNMSGGFTGDMYGYLVLSDTTTHSVLGMTTLLNRVGTGSGSAPQLTFGYQDSALNVTLSDMGANGNIHNYQNVIGYNSLITSGGSFQTDGGHLGSFDGADPNNTWTLFLADLSTGGWMQVNNWGLDIDVMPEPVTTAFLIFGGLVAAAQVMRRIRTVKTVASQEPASLVPLP